MIDVRDKEISVILFDGGLTVLKGGLYICTITNSEKFNAILANRFPQDTGLKSSTLREIADIIDALEKQMEDENDNMERANPN